MFLYFIYDTQPFIGDLCDRYDKKKVNMILLVISSIFGFSFILVHNIYLIAIVYSVVLALLNGINPIIERMVTVSKHKYGFILCCQYSYMCFRSIWYKRCKNNRKTSKMRKEGLLGMIGKSTATRYIKK